MRCLDEKIVVKSSVKEKRELLNTINQWMKTNFILNYNQVRLPKEPSLEIFDEFNAETPVLEEFKQLGLDGNHYLIGSLLSIGIALGKREKEIELMKEIKMLEVQVETLKADKKN